MPIQWFIDTFFAIIYIIVYRYVYVLAIYGTNHIIFPVFMFYCSCNRSLTANVGDWIYDLLL